MTIAESIEATARELSARKLAEIEAACERMLVSPAPVGVLVKTWPDQSWMVELSADEQPMEITYRQQAEGHAPSGPLLLTEGPDARG